MDSILCIRRISQYMEGKYHRRIGSRRTRIQISRGVFNRDKEGVWRRRGGITKGNRVEKNRVRRKEDGGVHIRF